MVTVMIPVACDEHDVHTVIDDNKVTGLFCVDCDTEYPAE